MPVITPIYTATFDRSDVACIWDAAVRSTLTTPHATVILHAHDKPPCGMAHATWAESGISLAGRPTMEAVFRGMVQSGPRAFIEEDIVPVREWSLDDYPGNPAILHSNPNQPWWAFTVYRDGPARPLMYSQFTLVPQRWVRDGGCPDWLPDALCEPALAANAKIAGNHFLHIDKFAHWHRRNPEKERLIQALADWVSGRQPIAPASEYAVPPRPPMPTIAERVRNFAKSAVSHVAAGMPRCTQEEIDARYAICQTCEHLRDGACTQCGCPVVRERAFVSKLSWSDQACPVGKWGKINSPDA